MKISIARLACLASFVVVAALSLRTIAAPAEPGAGALRVGEPMTHDNLTVYPILGAERLAGKKYLTLAEAMEQKIIKVYETGDVNRLSIENVSKDSDVYVQSGDIVKGGRQDRTIAMDFICPPGAKLPVDAFCVEHGRWRQRGSEAAAQFGSGSYQVSGNGLKVAVKSAGGQGEVWRQVEQLQKKTSENVGQSVQSMESASSLQLSLENKKLQETTEQYIKALSMAADKPNVIGFAFAVNGQIKSADVYASHDLFAKLWPALLRSTAVEAVADLQKGKTFEAPKMDAVKSFFADAENGKSSDRQVTDRVKMQTRDSEKHLLYETQDLSNKPAAAAPAAEQWIHRNYLLKDEAAQAALKARTESRLEQRQQQLEQRQQAPSPVENSAPQQRENK
jgi:hypothetical protein